MRDIYNRLMQMGWHWPHPGGLDKNDIDSIMTILKGVLKEGVQIADLGCWTGFSSIAFALAVKPYKGTVYAIDWFKGSENTGLKQVASEYDIKEVFKADVRYFDVADIIKIIDKPTYDAVKDFTDNSLDFVFVDADHRYRQVKQDIRDWYKKVKYKGIIAGHDCEFIVKSKTTRNIFEPGEDNPWNDDDYIDMHIGVVRAVSEIFPQAKIEGRRVWHWEKS